MSLRSTFDNGDDDGGRGCRPRDPSLLPENALCSSACKFYSRTPTDAAAAAASLRALHGNKYPRTLHVANFRDVSGIWRPELSARVAFAEKPSTSSDHAEEKLKRTMYSSARHLLVLALITSFASGQLDPQRTQPRRNNRNSIPTTLVPPTISQTTLAPPATIIAINPTASQSTPVVTLASEPPKQKSQILTPLRNRTTQTLPITTTQSSTTSTATSDDLDPYLEDLCIFPKDLEAFRVGQSWDVESCQKKCRCAFRDEPRDAKFDLVIQLTENMNERNPRQTEIRCSLPEQCSNIADRLASKRCSAYTNNFDTCDCPQEVDCGLPLEFTGQPMVSSTSQQKLFPSSSRATDATSTIAAATSTSTTTTTTPQLPTTTTTTTVPSTTLATSAPTVVATTLVPTTARLTPTKLAGSHHSQPHTTATVATTTTTTTTTAATIATDAPATVSSTSTRPTGPQVRLTATGEPRAAPSSLIQALEVPLERYAAHLLIALAVMTGLFVYMCYLYLRRAFRSSTIIITDYDNLAFPKQVLIDETDQNFRNKNKEVDGFSPRLLI